MQKEKELLKIMILVPVLCVLVILAACTAAEGKTTQEKESKTDGKTTVRTTNEETEAPKTVTETVTETTAETAASSFRQISQEEAKAMMARDDGHIIVDVRRQDEYDAGHIPGAILIPNESIETERPTELPDPDQIILVYCRSGRRSKEAAQKLFDMGYTNVYEFGGIIDWTGEIVTEDQR